MQTDNPSAAVSRPTTKPGPRPAPDAAGMPKAQAPLNNQEREAASEGYQQERTEKTEQDGRPQAQLPPLPPVKRPRFLVRLFNGCALRFLTRDYYTVDDELADYFYSEQAARQCAEKHLMRPGQYTIEPFNTKAQKHEV